MLQRARGESLIISGRQRGPTDGAKAKHKDFALHLENRSSLSPAALTSHVSNCVGARRAEPVGATLVCYPPFPPPPSLFLSEHNRNYVLFLLKLLQLRCVSTRTTESTLGQKSGLNSSYFYGDEKLRHGARCSHEGKKLLVGALGQELTLLPIYGQLPCFHLRVALLVLQLISGQCWSDSAIKVIQVLIADYLTQCLSFHQKQPLFFLFPLPLL